MSTLAAVVLLQAASGLEFSALVSAVAFLAGTVIALAKIAWSERLNRLNNAENERDYYRNVAITSMNQIADNQTSLTSGLSALTDVVEQAIHDDALGTSTRGGRTR